MELASYFLWYRFWWMYWRSVLSLSWNAIMDFNDTIIGYAAQVNITSMGSHIITSANNVTFTVLVYGFGTVIGYSYTAGITGKSLML